MNSEAEIKTAKTTRLLAKRASNYIFYGADNAPVEKRTQLIPCSMNLLEFHQNQR